MQYQKERKRRDYTQHEELTNIQFYNHSYYVF